LALDGSALFFQRGWGSSASGRGCYTCCTHRSCRFSRLQRLDPRVALRVCCIPQPIMGFTWFRCRLTRLRSSWRDQTPQRSMPFLAPRSPRAVSPFKAFPLSAAIRSPTGLSSNQFALTPDLSGLWWCSHENACSLLKTIHGLAFLLVVGPPSPPSPALSPREG